VREAECILDCLGQTRNTGFNCLVHTKPRIYSLQALSSQGAFAK